MEETSSSEIQQMEVDAGSTAENKKAAAPSTTIFVKGVPLTATKEEFDSYFSNIGPVKWSFLVKQKGKETHSGMGYVQFAMKEDTDKAIKELKKVPFQGQKLDITLAKPKIKENKPAGEGEAAEPPKPKPAPKPKPKPKAVTDPSKVNEPGAKEARVVLRNLEFSCNERNIQKAFKKFGEIVDISLPKSETRANSIKGFGFVQFSKREEAVKAVEEGNGMKLNGRIIVVDLALPKSQFDTLMESAKQGKLAETQDGAKAADESTEDAKDEESEDEGDEDETENDEDEGDDDEEEDEEDEEDESAESDQEESSEEDGSDHDEDSEEEDEEHDDKDTESDSEGSDEDEDEDKPAVKSKPKVQSNDTGEGKTVFIRNLLFETTEEELKECFSAFGKVLYSKIVKSDFGMSRGTGFVKFADEESVKKCLEAASVTPQRSVNIGAKSYRSVIQDNHEGGIVLGGRILSVALAVERGEAKKLEEDNKTKKIKEDKRNLYLAREGSIKADSEAAKSLSKAELERRAKAEQEKKKKLQNPNYFISKTRISVRSLPLSVDDKQLKELALRAVKERFANKENDEINMEGAKEPIKILQAKIERSKDRIDSSGKLRSKGFGFVEFSQHAHAMAALRQLNNNPTYFGAAKRLTVEFALENVLVLKKREERLKKIREKTGTEPEKKASKETEKRKARRERREERLRLEKTGGKAGKLPQSDEDGKKPASEKPGKDAPKRNASQPQPKQKQAQQQPVKVAKKPSSQKPGQKPVAHEKPKAKAPEVAPANKHQAAQPPQKKRKRNAEEDKFQKMVNSYKQKLFKGSDGSATSMNKWMSD